MARNKHKADPNQSSLLTESTAEVTTRQDPVPDIPPAPSPPDEPRHPGASITPSPRAKPHRSFHDDAGRRRFLFASTGSLASCLSCCRIVTVLMVCPDRGTVVSDTMPQERQEIADSLGEEWVRFGQRHPMISGSPPSRVRESHDCHADPVVKNPDPEIGWRPRVRIQGKVRDRGGHSDVYDAG